MNFNVCSWDQQFDFWWFNRPCGFWFKKCFLYIGVILQLWLLNFSIELCVEFFVSAGFIATHHSSWLHDQSAPERLLLLPLLLHRRRPRILLVHTPEIFSRSETSPWALQRTPHCCPLWWFWGSAWSPSPSDSSLVPMMSTTRHWWGSSTVTFLGG